MKIVSLSLALSLCLLSSCATKMEGGALAGAGIGATAGALISHSPEGAILGGALGALSGGLIGHGLDDNHKETLEQESPKTLRRIERGSPLTVYDIKQLTQANIDEQVIISQIRSTGSVFYLSTADIIDLKNAGVSQRVIDYMVRTPE